MHFKSELSSQAIYNKKLKNKSKDNLLEAETNKEDENCKMLI